MEASRQIRGLIALYLDDLIDLSLFADRFSDLFENIEDCNDSAAIQLSYRVETILAKASDGLISGSEFVESLRECLTGYSLRTDIIMKAPAEPSETIAAYAVDESG